jgi:hypothetical protein
VSTRQPTHARVPAAPADSAARTIAKLVLATLTLGSFAALPLDGSAAMEPGQTPSAAPAIAASTIVVARDRPRLPCELPRRVALAEHVSPLILCTSPEASLRRR